MHESEDFKEFYKSRDIVVSEQSSSDALHFNVFSLEDNGFPANAPAVYSKRSFYKISFIRGNNRCHYADKSIEMSGSTLMFFNPNVHIHGRHSLMRLAFSAFLKKRFFQKDYAGILKVCRCMQSTVNQVTA